jgi:hypothetical protein
MNKETKLRIKIAEAATKRFIENPRFTIQSLADDLNMKSAKIFDLFPNRSSILRYFYTSRILKFREEMAAFDDYSSFSLNEKLSALHLSVLDQFQEHREFVLQTCSHEWMSPFNTSGFETEYRAELKVIFESDNQIPATARPFINSLLFRSFFFQFIALIHFWKRDESRQYENSMALVDKWSAFIQEIFYSRIAEKGFDLAKFLFYMSPISGWIAGYDRSSKHEKQTI